MSTETINEINDLLNDKLFQVIGSTPKSIAESLTKIDLKNKKKEGSLIFAISVFASAVNKSTLETFLADNRFASVRPLLAAAMSIQGKSNMTALTLLGHCLLTTKMADSVTFTAEFRKKMGQNHLWAGELSSGSLSDKQKEILKEKKRLTDETSAMTLGTGFLKLTGIDTSPMTSAESDLFNLSVQPSRSDLPREQLAETSRTQYSSAESIPSNVNFRLSRSENVQIPEDVLNYRKNVVAQTDQQIAESIQSKGVEDFIQRTRTLMASDPDGSRTRRAGSVVSPPKK